jgi:hypothetical protein
MATVSDMQHLVEIYCDSIFLLTCESVSFLGLPRLYRIRFVNNEFKFQINTKKLRNSVFQNAIMQKD